MIFRDRPDGRRVRHDTPMSAVLPYVMRKRSEAAVMFSRDLDVESALAYVRAKNAAGDGPRYSLFGVFLAAAVRVMALKPRLNRFVSRRGLYSRNELCFSFIVKRALSEEAPERSAKVWYEPEDGIAAVMEKTNAAIDAMRSDRPSPDEREMATVHAIPGGKAAFTMLFRLLDAMNLAPKALIRADPLYTSAYFANLGSIGLETPFHHLYEWGTASMFVSLGRIFRKDSGKGAGRRHLNVKITVDERIADGIYFAHAASLLARFVRKPEELEMDLGAFVSAGLNESGEERGQEASEG